MRKYLIFFIFLYLISSSYAFAVSTTSTGFIPGQIWYSKDTIAEGDTVSIYTAVWNDASSSLSAKVEFYDQNVILGTRDVIVEPQSLKVVSVSWKVTSGDHVISAKIISPSVTISGKKQPVLIDNTSTESSRKFVSVVIKTIDGNPASSSDLIKNEINKATSSIGDILPTEVTAPITKNLDRISTFRENTLVNISQKKDDTKKSIDSMSKPISVATSTPDKTKVKTSTLSSGAVDDAAKKPIAYIKLFFLSILAFIFGSSLAFYSIVGIVLFIILRWLYRKISNK